MRWWLVVAGLTVAAGVSAAQDSWINVREVGASGSDFSTSASTTAGSKEITVEDVGDFAVGQGVMISGCHPRLLNEYLWGPGTTYGKDSRPGLKDLIDFRGWDATSDGWTVYVIDIEPKLPLRFRWSADMGRTWSELEPVTFDWQPLRGGLELRFHQFPWENGYSATVVARDQLVSVIEKIEGKVLTLRDAPSKSVPDAVVRHCDDAALQEAINRALAEHKNVFVPAGHYRLAGGLRVEQPSGLVIEGVNGEDSVLDISEGNGCCISMRGGTECTIRQLKLIGNMGFAERDQAGHFRTLGSRGIWGQDLKTSYATGVRGTERVLVEDCHAYHMSLEAFWSGGPARFGSREPEGYTQALNYVRCWAIDCARNGFNNNDLAENTAIQYCRIVNVGGCAWEGASRFVKFVGNYVRNAGTVAIGNISSRAGEMEILPSGQHIVSGNVFESVVPYGGCAIRSASGATPVLISDNIFVNFGSSAVELSATAGTGLPAYNSTVRGNVFDMTEVGESSRPRHAIDCNQSEVIIADNQILVRGDADAQVTAIRLREPALNVIVHDNLIRNCGVGLATARAVGRVTAVVDERTFEAAGVPQERRRSHQYRGWPVIWTAGEQVVGRSTCEAYDPETKRFTLTEARATKVGETFETYPPGAANWNIHHNIISGCLNPVVLDSYGSATSTLSDNVIVRDNTAGVMQAVQVRGRFSLLRNHFLGFDEPGSSVLALAPDRLGQPPANRYWGNVFERCAAAVGDAGLALWRAADTGENLFLETPAP